MQIIYDNLTTRTIIILIVGLAVLALDIFLITALLDQDEQGIINWFIVISVEIIGLIFIAYIISRQLIKPLKQLSEIAKRFSIDMHTDPLSIKGPKEVRETAQSFNLMQIRIQRFVEERMQLIAAISHDLRTPLTRLRLRVDNLENKEQRNKALADINEMSVMIKSTLAFFRNDAIKEKITKVDIASLIRTVCDNTSDTFGCAEYYGPDKCIQMCKPSAVKRALSNIIENAVKYGQKAKVNLVYSIEEITITIDDQGDGILENEFENVFMPFYRIENSRNLETGGVGLGLSVSKTIIQSSGGDITLQNREGGGLRVIVILPNSETVFLE